MFIYLFIHSLWCAYWFFSRSLIVQFNSFQRCKVHFKMLLIYWNHVNYIASTCEKHKQKIGTHGLNQLNDVVAVSDVTVATWKIWMIAIKRMNVSKVAWCLSSTEKSQPFQNRITKMFVTAAAAALKTFRNWKKDHGHWNEIKGKKHLLWD